MMLVILKYVTSGPSTGFGRTVRPVASTLATVVAPTTTGGSATGCTVSTNESPMLRGEPLIHFVAVTVTVVVPNAFNAGVMISVRVEPKPATPMLLSGTSVVLEDDVKIASASTANRNASGVSSGAVLSAMSSIEGSASNAPRSTVGVESPAAASTIRWNGAPR